MTKKTTSTNKKSKKTTTRTKKVSAVKVDAEKEVVKKVSPKKEVKATIDSSTFYKLAISQRWSMHDLVTSAYDWFGKDRVTVEKCNSNQVRFIVEGQLIPEVGHFTVG